MEFQIPKQWQDKGERYMCIFCGKCPRTPGALGKMWNLGQRQNIVHITGVLAAIEQEIGGKDLGGHTGKRRCEVSTTPRQASS